MDRLRFVTVSTPDLFNPKFVKKCVIICTNYDPKNMPNNLILDHYSDIELIELATDDFYEIAVSTLPLRVGQYLVRNTWLEEQLQSAEEIYMHYDNLGDLIAGMRRAKGYYKYVKVPNLRQIGHYAETLIWEAYHRTVDPAIATDVEAFVIAYPATFSKRTIGALDMLIGMTSERQANGKLNPCRNTLRGFSAQKTAVDAILHCEGVEIMIEARVYIAMDRLRQMTEALTITRRVAGNRWHSNFDVSNVGKYCHELHDEGTRIAAIHARPTSRMIAHCQRDLWAAETRYRDGNIEAGDAILKKVMRVLDLTINVYPRVFGLRLALQQLTDQPAPIENPVRRELCRETQEIRDLTRTPQGEPHLDDLLIGAPVVRPLNRHLEEADHMITDGFIHAAYREVTQSMRTA